MDNHKLSIITVNYNDRVGLEATIDSLSCQNEKNFEFIIIDGGSNDGSVDLLKEKSEIINYWVSEKDDGIYAAMNKGINQAKGDYCLFLNSGDILYNENVIHMIYTDLVETKNESDLIFGQISINRPNNIEYYPTKITLTHLIKSYLPHPATLFKRSLIMDGYDLSFEICADYELILRLLKNNCTYKCIEKPLAIFYTDGISSNQDKFDQIKFERMVIQQKIFGNIVLDYFERLYSFEKRLPLFNRILNKIIR